MRALVAALAVAGCAPDLGGDPARVDGPRVLAVWAEPAEARPGEPVVLQALIATPDGEAPAAAFAWCTDARAVAENRVAGPACLEGRAVVAAGPAPVVPADACALFGSEPPPAGPGEIPRRPADPDATGGYYQPVRVTAPDVPPAMGRVRLRCALPGAPAEVAARYAREAVPNQNPVIDGQLIEMQGEVLLGLEADAPETYLHYDVASAALSRRTEAYRATWYTSSGTIEGDLAGARWTPDERPAWAWVVVRDDRGGVAGWAWAVE